MRDEIIDLQSLREAVRRGHRPQYLMFWGHRANAGEVTSACLSQWWAAPFVVDGGTYSSAEQFMMAEKARLFGDHEVRAQILSASDPAEAKRLGRTVRGFECTTWEKKRVDIVVSGNLAKFRQNAALQSFLIGTKERVLVEASPVDRIWGIGMAADDPAARDPECWPGLNLLGFALMSVRRTLVNRTG
jgi:ribA/ribD-fused uncharacterized protein